MAIRYVDAPLGAGRRAFIPLGMNRCTEMQPTLFPSGPSTPALEWCSNDNTMGKSAFDAAEVYTAAGYAESSDGESLYLYYGGMAYTHNENPSTASGRHTPNPTKPSSSALPRSLSFNPSDTEFLPCFCFKNILGGRGG